MFWVLYSVLGSRVSQGARLTLACGVPSCGFPRSLRVTCCQGGRARGGEEYDRIRRVTRQDRLRVGCRLLFGEGGFVAEPAFLAVRGDCVPPKHVPVIPPVRVAYPAESGDYHG